MVIEGELGLFGSLFLYLFELGEKLANKIKKKKTVYTIPKGLSDENVEFLKSKGFHFSEEKKV